MKTTAEAMTLPVSVGNTYLGAPQKPSSIQLIHDQHKEEYDDRTVICLGMDMTISAYYFGILKLLCTHFEVYKLIFIKELEL